jgi:6-phosphogluconate dehydrogenase
MVFIARQLIMQMGTGNGRENRMQLGMIGLGRMGANLVRRLLRHGHDCVVFDQSPEAVAGLVGKGITGGADLADLVGKLAKPRNVWVMLPAGEITEQTVAELGRLLEPGDTIIDGGNSYYSRRHAARQAR